MVMLLNDFVFDTYIMHGLALVDFYADWCSPCKAFEPIYDEVSTEIGSKVKFLKLNVDDGYESASKYRIMSVPTIIAFKNGVEVARHTGSMDKEKLREFVAALIAT